VRLRRTTQRPAGGNALHSERGRPPRIPESWIRFWELRPPPPPPPRPWYLRIWGAPEELPPPPWYRRLATPWGTPEVAADVYVEAPERVDTAPALPVPVFRALVIPCALGCLFSLLSLVVGANIPARLRAALPHRSVVVQQGETLSQIADRHGVSWRDLHRAGSNPKRHPDPDRIPAGARLDLPYAAGFGFGVGDTPRLELSLATGGSGVRVCGALHELPLVPADWAVRLCGDA
jgi:hypothetical protein